MDVLNFDNHVVNVGLPFLGAVHRASSLNGELYEGMCDVNIEELIQSSYMCTFSSNFLFRQERCKAVNKEAFPLDVDMKWFHAWFDPLPMHMELCLRSLDRYAAEISTLTSIHSPVEHSVSVFVELLNFSNISDLCSRLHQRKHYGNVVSVQMYVSVFVRAFKKLSQKLW